MGKNPGNAEALFKAHLEENQKSEKIIVFVISEKDLLRLLPENYISVYFEAPIETIKKRFSERMQGNLSAPVAAMLEKKHGMFHNQVYTLRFDTSITKEDEICSSILSYCM